MKNITITSMLAALGILAGPMAFAQPGPANRPYRPGGADRPDVRRINPEQRSGMLLNRYDANRNGQLDDAEYIALGKDVEAGRVGSRAMAGRPGLAGPGPRGGRGQRGPRAGAPFGPRHQELLNRYDANENNVLDPAERARIRQAIEDGAVQAPPRGQGRRGFGPPPGRGAGRRGQAHPDQD